MSVTSRLTGLVWCIVPGAIAAMLATAPARSTAAGEWVHLGEQFHPGGAVALDASAILSPGHVEMSNGPVPTRHLSVSVVAKVGAVVLEHRHELRPVASDLADPVKVSVGPLSLNYVPYFANKALGVDVAVGEPSYSDEYVVSLAPLTGKTWASVATEADCSFTVEARAR